MKLNPNGELIRHKARLVVKRFLQKEGIDINEFFVLFSRIKIIRLIVSLTNINNWSMCLMDVKCAFLNDPLDEEVYISQPDDFEKEGQESKAYMLHKA